MLLRPAITCRWLKPLGTPRDEAEILQPFPALHFELERERKPDDALCVAITAVPTYRT